MKEITITHDQLAALLSDLKGAAIISLTWTSGESARYAQDRGRIDKVSCFSGMINARYDRKKAKAAGIPVDMVEVAGVNWLHHNGTCVSIHNGGKKGRENPKFGTRYVTFYPASGGTTFKLDGVPCGREKVAKLLKPSYGGKGKDRVAFRRITLDGITGAVINKTHYRVGA